MGADLRVMESIIDFTKKIPSLVSLTACIVFKHKIGGKTYSY